MLVIYITVSVLFCTNFVPVSSKTDNGRESGKKDGSQIVFPDSSESVEATEDLPLHLARQMNEVSDMEEFFHTFLEPTSARSGYLPLSIASVGGIAARVGSLDVERSAIQAAKMARCMPELKTVPLKPGKNTATFHFPSCTRVNRCGGCCSHHLLSCQPVESEILRMSVVISDYLGGNKLRPRGKEIVEVEQHTKCKCDCKIKKEDCTRYQKYSREKCLCECTNTDEERKCYEEGGRKKLWNKDTCSCECKEVLECGSEFTFDPFNCSCVPNRGRRKPSFIYDVD